MVSPRTIRVVTSPEGGTTLKELYYNFEVPIQIFLGAITMAALTYGVMWAGLNTIQSHASTITNLYGAIQGLINIAYGGSGGKAPLKVGVFFMIMGSMLMCFDPDALRVGEGGGANVKGSLLSLLVNIPYLMFFKINLRLKKVI